MIWNPFRRKTQAGTPVSAPPNRDNTFQNNRTFGIFKNVDNDIERIVATKSVVGKSLQDAPPMMPSWTTMELDSSSLIMPISTNKIERLNQYRSMARYTESDWCLNEICDEFINEDQDGNFIKLTLPDDKTNLNETRKSIIQKEFKRYMNLFKFENEGFWLVKRYLVEGELAWENIIDPTQPELGIRGVKFLPAEYYELLLDTKTNTSVGLVFDTEKYSRDMHEILSNQYYSSAQVFNTISPTTAQFNIDLKTAIPMLWAQLTYISSGEKSYDGLMVFPMIEKTRQAYQQLSLLQESIIVRRVTRSPERLLFNIGTGNMSPHLSDEHVRSFAMGLKAKKVAQPNGDVSSVYNPVSMLETYVFAKADGSEGTTASTVGSTADFDQIGDMEFFLRRFMKQFNVPFSRYKTPENAITPPDQLAAEEHSFLKMIIREQRKFALGFKNGFITNLKLRGMWDKYNLVDEDIDVKFVKPSMFEVLEIQHLVDAQMNTYKTALGDDKEFSKRLAMKKYLKMTDAEIDENYRNLIQEKMLTELAEYYGGLVSKNGGLEGWECPIPFRSDVQAQQKADTIPIAQPAGNAPKEGDGEEGEGNEGGDEAAEGNGDLGSGEAPPEPADKEAPEPSFGLS